MTTIIFNHLIPSSDIARSNVFLLARDCLTSFLRKAHLEIQDMLYNQLITIFLSLSPQRKSLLQC